MTSHTCVVERAGSSITVRTLEADASRPDGLGIVTVAGRGSLDWLARTGAEDHFLRHPERSSVLVVVLQEIAAVSP